MKKLNKEEIVVGCVVAFAFFGITRWWTLLTIPVCGLLWALGGMEGVSKIVRRGGVPLALCGLAAIASGSWIPLVSIPFFFAALTRGYGVPSWKNGELDDEGSDLGRFWWLKTHGSMTPGTEGDRMWVDFLVRGTLACLYGFTLVSFAWVSFGWWLFGTTLVTMLVPITVGVVE